MAAEVNRLIRDQPRGRESKDILLWRVGKHPEPLESYSFWARWLIRAVYFLTGYQTTSEDICIASSEKMARAFCLDGRYFYKPLYLDKALGDEATAPGPTVWPHKSKAVRWLYQTRSPDMVSIPRRDFEQLGMKVEDVFHASKL